LSIEGVEGTLHHLDANLQQLKLKTFHAPDLGIHAPGGLPLVFESSHPQIRGGSWKLPFESSRAFLSCNSTFKIE